jgi:ABC-type lipoprotein export system ATPase subunit
MRAMMNRLTIDAVQKDYTRDKVTALCGVSFELSEGEAVAIMGPSGCGKSTLLNVIGTLDPPTGGEVRFNGEPVPYGIRAAGFRARRLGFVFQFHHLIPGMTVVENIEAACRARAVTRKTARREARALLEDFGLGDRLHFLPGRISGGERQRVAVARALVNRPSIILADEPTGNLDSATGEEVIRLLLDRAREQGAMVVFATHDPDKARRADRILKLKDGRLQ